MSRGARSLHPATFVTAAPAAPVSCGDATGQLEDERIVEGARDQHAVEARMPGARKREVAVAVQSIGPR